MGERLILNAKKIDFMINSYLIVLDFFEITEKTTNYNMIAK